MSENFYCDQCQKKLYVVHVDGYGFGSRLLEDVMFEVENCDGKPIALQVEQDAEPYFQQLNRKYWFDMCEEYCKDLDTAYCPTCGGEVGVWAG